LSNLPKSQIIKNLMNSIQISSLKLNDQSQVVNNIQRFQVVQKMLQSWTNIQQIDFDCFGIGKSKVKIGDEEIDQLASTLIKCQMLQSLILNLNDNKIQDQGMSKLGFALTQCKQLQNLNLFIVGNKFGLKGISTLALAILQCEKIEILKLCKILSFQLIENAINNQLTKNFAHYKVIEIRIDEFYEQNQPFNYTLLGYELKASHIELFLQNCQNLQSLQIDLDFFQVSDNELSKALLTLANAKKLKSFSLKLNNTLISPVGVNVLLAFLRKCQFLQVLNIFLKQSIYVGQSTYKNSSINKIFYDGLGQIGLAYQLQLNYITWQSNPGNEGYSYKNIQLECFFITTDKSKMRKSQLQNRVPQLITEYLTFKFQPEINFASAKQHIKINGIKQARKEFGTNWTNILVIAELHNMVKQTIFICELQINLSNDTKKGCIFTLDVFLMLQINMVTQEMKVIRIKAYNQTHFFIATDKSKMRKSQQQNSKKANPSAYSQQVSNPANHPIAQRERIAKCQKHCKTSQ
ncbi:hypothetical protein ABPG74_020095, partial [Tetrahymena malaccensis]